MTGRMPVPDPGIVEAAQTALDEALAGRPLVSAERFCSSMRSLYAGPGPRTLTRPALAIGCYPGWEQAGPHAVLAAQDRVRGAEKRHGWTSVVDSEAAELLSTLPAPPAIAAIDGNLRADRGRGRLQRPARGGRSAGAGADPVPTRRGKLPPLTELRRARSVRGGWWCNPGPTPADGAQTLRSHDQWNGPAGVIYLVHAVDVSKAHPT
ncbi:hypothetical protein [Streptomyces sp. NPDC006510]|uniref:hypothetical protein n=1 Tax=Streptomyces sp. NPDC006510 TaxID=3155600 RepID=UPI0033B3F8DB